MNSTPQTKYGATAAGNANTQSGVSVSSDISLREGAVAEGVYHVECLIPRGQDMDAYLRTRDRIAEIEVRGLLYRLAHFREVDYLKEKLADFELEPMWTDVAHNLVTTVGKNLALDTYLSGSAYTVTGPYMGLISSVSFTAVAAGDTMASHAGWLEAGGANAPTYTAPRKTAAWSAASAGAKALSASLAFAMTGSGTIKGCFLVFGTGALSTIDNAAGTLYSAGLFTGGDQPVVNGNTVNVSYSTSL